MPFLLITYSCSYIPPLLRSNHPAYLYYKNVYFHSIKFLLLIIMKMFLVKWRAFWANVLAHVDNISRRLDAILPLQHVICPVEVWFPES